MRDQGCYSNPCCLERAVLGDLELESNPMNSRSYGAPDSGDNEEVVLEQVGEDGSEGGSGDAEERLGNELAAFAFLREEDDREVRLSFRDVPADSIANAFRRAGALFISLTGERARNVQVAPVSSVGVAGVAGDSVEGEVQPLSRRKRRHKASAEERVAQSEGGLPPGELTMRYFYATEELVYTVIITSSTGIIKSIAGVFPSAELSEREVRVRLGAVVR